MLLTFVSHLRMITNKMVFNAVVQVLSKHVFIPDDYDSLLLGC